MPRKTPPTRRRNGIAAALRSFPQRVVKPRKGAKAFKRKPKHPLHNED